MPPNCSCRDNTASADQGPRRGSLKKESRHGLQVLKSAGWNTGENTGNVKREASHMHSRSLCCMNPHWVNVKHIRVTCGGRQRKPRGINSPPVLFWWGWHYKICPTEWLKQQKFIFSQFWRLEVWDECVDRFGFFWDFLSPLLWMSTFSLCPHMIFPVYLCPLLMRTQSYWTKAHLSLRDICTELGIPQLGEYDCPELNFIFIKQGYYMF